MAQRKWREPSELAAFLRRMARALTRRAAEGDTEALAALVEARRSVDEQIGEAARALHAFGYSWSEIAAVLGTSKQNAQKRFAQNGGDE